VQIVNLSAPWKIGSGAENLDLEVLQFQLVVICCKLPGRASISHYIPNDCFVDDQLNVSAYWLTSVVYQWSS
jgi:hypothetical protein